MRLLFILLFAVSVNAQEFKLNDNNVIWQKILENVSDSDYDKLLSLNTHTNGKLEPMPVDYEAVGMKRGNVVMLLLMYNITGSVQFDRKENRVRILISDIFFEKNVDAVRMADNKMRFEDYALRRGEWTRNFLNHEDLLNHHFESLFEVNSYDSDW